MAGPTLNATESASEHSKTLALIVHELRSPAAVVNGYLRLLLKRSGGGWSEGDRKLVEDASQSCTRLAQVLQELDELADLEGGDPLRARTPIPIFELCEDVVRAIGDDALTFHCEPADRDARVHGDPARLHQAIHALATVTRREHRRGAEMYGFVGGEGDDGEPRATIAFGEPGLAARRTALMADRAGFDRWRGGTGLALPIASRIVEAHGGRLWSLCGDTLAASALSLPLKGA